eukprot:5477004-Amphidinium_carterae.2
MAWKSRRTSPRTFDHRKELAKGVYPKPPLHFCETLTEALETDIRAIEPCILRSGHVLGDGNCGW